MQNMEQSFKAKLGKGAYATCYLTDDNEVIKLYDSILKGKPLINIENDTYVFPYKISYDINGNIIFSLMPFIRGRSINKETIAIDKIISGIDKIYQDTDKLSESNIIIVDVNGKNILYNSTNNKFNIIDTDFFYYNEDFSYSKLTTMNTRHLNSAFIYETINDSKDIDTLITKSHCLYQIYSSMEKTSDNKLLKEYLITLKQFLEDRLSKDIVTLSDMKKAVRKL